MANNRLYLCEVDDDGKIVDLAKIAKNSGEGWYFFGSVERINELFRNSFVNGHGISLTDEYSDEPMGIVYNGW